MTKRKNAADYAADADAIMADIAQLLADLHRLHDKSRPRLAELFERVIAVQLLGYDHVEEPPNDPRHWCLTDTDILFSIAGSFNIGEISEQAVREKYGKNPADKRTFSKSND